MTEAKLQTGNAIQEQLRQVRQGINDLDSMPLLADYTLLEVRYVTADGAKFSANITGIINLVTLYNLLHKSGKEQAHMLQQEFDQL